ncbi:hypothetical protein KIW84_042345 [Lathyrus oleraceus]|uniref:Small RNA 2'-O-methyltransferase n=1 Tax=Pisum sativum TaxID=3888 RepID=A0A9D4XCI8_PEA|nr:hypothetical protein KIW84_042345 [Pisum sativum]
MLAHQILALVFPEPGPNTAHCSINKSIIQCLIQTQATMERLKSTSPCSPFDMLIVIQDLRQQANETRAAAAIPVTVRQHATACPDNEAATSESVMLDGAHTVPTIPNSQADVIMPDLPPPLDNPDDMIIKPTGNVSEVIADSKELKQKIKLMTWPLKELQLHGFNIGTCLEVIEYMDESQVYLFRDVALSCFRPRTLIISIPKFEYNCSPEKIKPNHMTVSAWEKARNSLMTCVRLLEILLVLVDKLFLFDGEELRNFTMLVKNKLGVKWIHNLMEWGKSMLKVVIIYWKRALTYLLNLFKGSSNKTSVSAIMVIEILITSNGYTLEELTEHVSRLTMSLSSEDSHIFQLQPYPP